MNCIVVQPLSYVLLFGTLWTIARRAPLSSTVLQSLLIFMSTESVMLYNSSEVGIILILFFKSVQSSSLVIPLTAPAEMAPYYLMNLVDLI